MNRNHSLPAVLLVATVLASPAGAQLTGNDQTNIISGVTSNWTGNYYVGSNFVFDALLVQNGGKLFNAFGYSGYTSTASNNSILVTGSGSIWSNGNDLILGYAGS